ncbi:MAG: hypothetical protein ACXAC8_14770 [Candidatus Hodarchaeales archaeon]|jgi:hypothetical protein
MYESSDIKEESVSISTLESKIQKQIEDKISMLKEEIQDLIGDYKAKRNLWEVKLKSNDDPRRPEFYAIMARLTMLDIIVADLEYFNQLFQ